MGKAHAARALRISQRLHVLSACMLAWQVHWLELENDDGTHLQVRALASHKLSVNSYVAIFEGTTSCVNLQFSSC